MTKSEFLKAKTSTIGRFFSTANSIEEMTFSVKSILLDSTYDSNSVKLEGNTNGLYFAFFVISITVDNKYLQRC
jgi:hypothetical protein